MFFFDATGKTISLVEADGLDAAGVSLQCLYSFCKEQWKVEADLIKYPFPWVAITAEQFELIKNRIEATLLEKNNINYNKINVELI